MKLVIINTTGGPGSTIGRLVATLADGLSREGFVTRLGVGRGHGDLVLGSEGNHHLNALQARIRDNDGFLDPKATKRLCAWIESEKPDIVHLHNLHGYYLDMRLLFDTLAAAECRIVVTLHDNWLLTGHCAVIPADCKAYGNYCRRCKHNAAYPAALRVSKPAGRRRRKSTILHSVSDRLTLVTPSKHLAALVGESELGDLPLETIHNGVSDIFYNKRAERKPASHDALRLLAVSRRWLGEKNLPALERLAQVMPQGWSLTIVGETESQKNTPRIDYRGNVCDSASMAKLYASHDILLCPSANESFGLVVAEALACGTPAVVNAQSASAELLSPSDGLTDSFTDMPSLIDTIRRASRLVPETAYTDEAMISGYAALFRRLLV